MSQIPLIQISPTKLINFDSVRVISFSPNNDRIEFWEQYPIASTRLHTLTGDAAVTFHTWFQTYAATPNASTTIPQSGFVRLSQAVALNMHHVRTLRYSDSLTPTVKYLIHFLADEAQPDRPLYTFVDDDAQTVRTWFQNAAYNPETGYAPPTSETTRTESGLWRFDTALSGTMSEGCVATNNANLALATELRLNVMSDENRNYLTMFQLMVTDDEMFMQVNNNASIAGRYRLTAAGTAIGASWTFPVTLISGGGVAPDVNTVMYVKCII